MPPSKPVDVTEAIAKQMNDNPPGILAKTRRRKNPTIAGQSVTNLLKKSDAGSKKMSPKRA